MQITPPLGSSSTATRDPAAAVAAPLPDLAESAQGPFSPPSADDGRNRITVSHGGHLLAKTKDDGTDAVTRAIEDSKYPEQIKKLMIKIRELQARLREKAAELQEVAADQKLAPRQREMKMAALRDAVGTMTSAIRTATATLNDTLTVMRFSRQDRDAIRGAAGGRLVGCGIATGQKSRVRAEASADTKASDAESVAPLIVGNFIHADCQQLCRRVMSIQLV